MTEIEDLVDLIDALQNCIRNIKSNTAEFNVSLVKSLIIFICNIDQGMPVFILIEERLVKKISEIKSNEAKLSKEDALVSNRVN